MVCIPHYAQEEQIASAFKVKALIKIRIQCLDRCLWFLFSRLKDSRLKHFEANNGWTFNFGCVSTTQIKTFF